MVPFFETIWTSSMGNVSSILGNIQNVAYTLVGVLLILGVYEAFARGGNMRDLLVHVLKCAICIFLITNWTAFFTDITTNGVFKIAGSLGGTDFYKALGTGQDGLTGIGDMLTNQQSFSWTGLGKDLALLINDGAIGLAVFAYYIIYYAFEILFTAWGLILYALGPLLVAMLPSSFVAPIGKQYLQSLGQWLLWPILYTVIGTLSTSINTYQSTITVNGANNFAQAIITLIFILMMAVIPFIAHSFIKGDFANAAGTTMRMAMAAASPSHAAGAHHSGGGDSGDSGGSGGSGGSSGGGGGGGNGSSGNSSSGGTSGPPAITPASDTASTPSATPPAGAGATSSASYGTYTGDNAGAVEGGQQAQAPSSTSTGGSEESSGFTSQGGYYGHTMRSAGSVDLTSGA